MKGATLLLLMLCHPHLDAEGPDWEQFFEAAWDRGSLGKEVAWALRGASARLRAEEAQWFPVVSLGSEATRPQQLAARSFGGVETFSVAATGSLVQRVPGGGSVRASVRLEPAWAGWHPGSAPDWAPVFSFEGTLPFVASPTRDLERETYEQEVLDQALVTRRGWLALVQGAADLDLARLTLVARRAREVVAAQRVSATGELRLQGRASEASVAAEQGALTRARWESLQAEAALTLAEGQWQHRVGLPLPPVDEGLVTWAQRDHGRRIADLDVDLQVVRSRGDGLRIRERGADLAPVLGWGLSVSRPKGHAAVLELQLGISMTTDVLLTGPAIEALRWSWEVRSDLAVDRARTEALLRAEVRDRFLSSLRTARADIERSRRAAQQVRDSLLQAARRGQALGSEVLEAEAGVAELDLLARQLLWEEVLEVGFR